MIRRPRVSAVVLSAAALMALGWAACGDDAATATGAGGSGGAGGTTGQGGAGGTAPPAEPYTITAFDNQRISSNPDDPNFHDVFSDIALIDGPFASVTLVIDLDTTCYPFEKWQDNPPPAGENWPADCDAFDRNFEWSLDDPDNDAGPAGIELVRAITPFGGPLHLEIDITDMANGLVADGGDGTHRLRSHITTWSDGAGMVSGSAGGWFVSANIDVVPGLPPIAAMTPQPLFYDSVTTSEGPDPITFTVPEGATGGRIEYRVTGHGGGASGPGCIGPAEEFCKRWHHVFIDGAEIASFEPWRDDCGDLCTLTHYGPATAGFDYCLENPMGSIASVNASRANWCPGSLTDAIVFDTGPLAPGDHTFDWTIDGVVDGGSWTVSAVYVPYGS
jgi:Peptide-N-glycosidase F, C terminal